MKPLFELPELFTLNAAGADPVGDIEPQPATCTNGCRAGGPGGECAMGCAGGKGIMEH